MLDTIAIDDEPIALEVVKNLAAKIPFLSMKGFFTNAFEAAEFLHHNKIDLIFLDIKMPDISGIDFLQSIANPPMVIFTTAYSEHAVQSFELNAIDYLLKPFSMSRFLKACNKAQEQWELRQQNNTTLPTAVFIKDGYGQQRVELSDVLYAESNGNYMLFVLKGNKKITSRLTMAEAEVLLPATSFIRIHRSYIISKKQVTKIEKNTLWIRETELPVGASYAGDVAKMIAST